MRRTTATVAAVGRHTTPQSGFMPLGRETVDRFTHLLLECLEREEVLALLRHAVASAESSGSTGRRPGSMLDHWSRKASAAHQIVSEWWSDPHYVDARGRPRALPKRGARSIEALTRRFSPTVHVDDALDYLIQTGTVERAGSRYLAARRWASTHGNQGPERVLSLRAVADLLRTMEHNVLPGEGPMGWFQRVAENTQVPVSRLPEIERQLERKGMPFLLWWDGYLRQCAKQCRAGESTVRFGIGVYRFQEGREDAERARRRRGNGVSVRKPAILSGRKP